MIYLFCLLIPYLLGRGAMRAFYGKSPTQDITCADSILTGSMIIIGLAEAAHVGAVVLGRSFSDCKILFLAGLVVLLLVAGVLVVIEMRRKKQEKTAARVLPPNPRQKEEQILFFAFGIMVLIQVLLMITRQKIYTAGDMTVETVNTMLVTDTIYQINPMTGQAYALGMPMRLKILCLPTLYAILCDLCGLSAVQLVWTVVPVIILLGSYLAFHTVARALFAEDGVKRGFFMVLVALLLWVGDYMYGMDGFGVQYAGFRGVSVRMAILLPYTFGLILRRKWKPVVLCILAEACIVWTLYGMGACLFVAVAMAVSGLLGKKLSSCENRFRKNEKLQGGEEDSR